MSAENELNVAIARLGRHTGPQVIGELINLFRPLHEIEPYLGVAVSRDLAYGSNERHRLDIFVAGEKADGAKPVFVFIHGGAFVAGAKHTPGSPFNSNMGVWAARNGMVGVVINYRLAPEHQWPAGRDDLSAAVDWIISHISEHGGDPSRIFLCGASAGGAHVAGYLAGNDSAADKIAGAVLLSGLYDITTCEKNPPLLAYFGADESLYAERSSLKALVETPVPVLASVAEHDPQDFERQALGYVNAYFACHGYWPNLIRLIGDNHFSSGWRVGTASDYLAGQMLAFMERATKTRQRD